MRLTTRIAFALLFIPLVASAQYRSLDTALESLERGFGGGDVDAIVSGISNDEQVQLQFPGLADKSGFFGRDQAAYLLEGLFNRTRPGGFERVSVKKVSAEGQYHIKARWTTKDGDRDLYITLQQKGERWAIASVRSAG